MARPFGEVSYTLTDVIVAAYNFDANSYGTPDHLADGQLVEIEPEGDNDDLRSYGIIARKLSVVTGAKVTIGAGGIDYSVLSILSGRVNSSSGTTPHQVFKSKQPAGGNGLGWFGLIGVSATDGGGYMVVGLQAAKLDKAPKFTMDGKENKFNVSETAGGAVPVGGYLDWVQEYESLADWVAPSTGANFLAFFS